MIACGEVLATNSPAGNGAEWALVDAGRGEKMLATGGRGDDPIEMTLPPAAWSNRPRSENASLCGRGFADVHPGA